MDEGGAGSCSRERGLRASGLDDGEGTAIFGRAPTATAVVRIRTTAGRTVDASSLGVAEVLDASLFVAFVGPGERWVSLTALDAAGATIERYDNPTP